MTTQITRSRQQRVVSGVAGGVAQVIGIDPVFLRLGLVGLMFVDPLRTMALYFVLALIIPTGPRSAERSSVSRTAARTPGGYAYGVCGVIGIAGRLLAVCARVFGIVLRSLLRAVRSGISVGLTTYRAMGTSLPRSSPDADTASAPASASSLPVPQSRIDLDVADRTADERRLSADRRRRDVAARLPEVDRARAAERVDAIGTSDEERLEHEIQRRIERTEREARSAIERSVSEASGGGSQETRRSKGRIRRSVGLLFIGGGVWWALWTSGAAPAPDALAATLIAAFQPWMAPAALLVVGAWLLVRGGRVG